MPKITLAQLRLNAATMCGKAAMKLRLAATDDQHAEAGGVCALAIDALRAIRQDRDPNPQVSSALRIANALENLGLADEISNHDLAAMYEAAGWACHSNGLV